MKIVVFYILVLLSISKTLLAGESLGPVKTLNSINFFMPVDAYYANDKKNLKFNYKGDMSAGTKISIDNNKTEIKSEKSLENERQVDTFYSEINGSEQTIATISSYTRVPNDPSKDGLHRANLWKIKEGAIEGYTECSHSDSPYSDYRYKTKQVKYCFTINQAKCEQFIKQFAEMGNEKEVEKCRRIIGSASEILKTIEPATNDMEYLNSFSKKNPIHGGLQAGFTKGDVDKMSSDLEAVLKAKDGCLNYSKIWRSTNSDSTASPMSKSVR